MEKVLGIGGTFLRARDREALARWYAEHLGVAIDESWWGAALPLSSPDDHAGACVAEVVDGRQRLSDPDVV